MSKEEKKVAFRCSSQLVSVLDEVSKSFGLSRSDFIRLKIQEVLVNMGYLSRETRSPLATEQGVKA
jgi:metal-responsive CopG/Arc/MetJ family transcriptional regulator